VKTIVFNSAGSAHPRASSAENRYQKGTGFADVGLRGDGELFQTRRGQMVKWDVASRQRTQAVASSELDRAFRDRAGRRGRVGFADDRRGMAFVFAV